MGVGFGTCTRAPSLVEKFCMMSSGWCLEDVAGRTISALLAVEDFQGDRSGGGRDDMDDG